ncbi:Ig-like domain-containing protein [Sinomicrobium soli]|uniref:Ig-like domain-containing protein n=1 Tax=Sinomicrobium sp. N-1-3-6 TaxID=2219864 RepID=UPI000DCE0451|nr:hypothetical protein [Sinomicrobium sp. N-1-3-6]RAV27758.1 hypothetical protein DN748_17215 [Sinomicrobium sp. N-1-3-6]
MIFKKNKISVILWSCVLAWLFVQPVSAQFTITDDFRNQGSPDVVIGDNAYFTSGVADPVGAGWLRLTEAAGNQKGYAYINRSFPSTLGLIVDFEYTMWRDNSDNTYHGADGFAMFLFDAAYGPGNFVLGAYGGSLAYANSTQSSPNTGGVTGGYVGVGFDAYGNFVRSSEGKNGGSSGLSPNSIALRGPTTSNSPSDSNTNRYLDGVTILNNGSIVDALDEAGNAQHDVIDYNTTVTERPSYSTFYRRVQLEIIPTTGNTYRIIVRWTTTQGGAFTELIDYTTNEAPPSLLKLGFGASTGGGWNYHELRNLQITTPNNLRVTKKADKDILRSVPAGNNANEITYTIEVTNDTDQPYTNATFLDELIDINGDPIPTSMFHIDNISHSGFDAISIAQIPGENKIEGNLTIPANTIGYITVTGTLNGIPLSNLLSNRVTVLSVDNDDFDLGNNTFTVNTPVIAENVDLMLQKNTVGSDCLDETNGNTYELQVTNMGTLDATYRRTGSSSDNNRNRIVVIKDIPPGFDYDDSATPGGFYTNLNTTTNGSPARRWSKVILNNTPSSGYTRHIYIARGASNADLTLAGMGTTMPYPIRYTITPPSGTTSYVDEATVEYRGANGNTAYDGGNIESSYSPPNTANNTHTETIATISTPPEVGSATIYYCQGDIAAALTAEADTGNTLNWYLNEGGVPATTAPTPFTDVLGTTTYYVSQTNGSCESELAEIEVVVLEKPTSGSISGGEEICENTQPGQIDNNASGTGFGTITYRWEYSGDNGNTWEVVSGATGANYQPPVLYTDTQYRRITIATNTGGHSCESDATNEILISTRNCTVITNPMLPSRAKQ